MKLFLKIKLLIQPENLLKAFCDLFKINYDNTVSIIKSRQVGYTTHLANKINQSLFLIHIAIEKKYNNDINSFNIDWARFNILKAFA
jgi:capsule polysaccharide export protein KpsE/RkpR